MAKPTTLNPKELAIHGRVALVASMYNREIVDRLVSGARQALDEAGVEASGPIWVPGALELPIACRWVVETEVPAAVVALGCVLRGETFHFDIVAHRSSEGLQAIAITTGVPVLNAVLACEEQAQAEDRSRPDTTNKGYEAAAAALYMARLREKLNE